MCMLNSAHVWKHAAVVVMAIFAMVGSCFAQEFPARPITLMVVQGPGGPTDILARAVAAGMSERLGKQVIVENRPGANGAIASQALIRSAPDGYTLLFTVNGAQTLAPFAQTGSKYDPVRDFTPITMVGRYYLVIVANKNLAAKTFPELIELAKSKPRGLLVATFGTGNRLTVGQLKAATNVSLIEVPYPDAVKGLQALVSGDIDIFFDGTGLARTRVDDGIYRAIAVLGPRRVPNLPEVPTVAEYIPGFEAPLWQGIVAPAGLPADIREKLRTAIVEALASARVRDAATALGITEISGNSSEEFGNIIAEEAKKNPELIKRYNLAVE